MEFHDAASTMGTCRFYRDEPVPDDMLVRAVDVARFAPTGGNRQGVRFVVVKDAAKRRQLAELYVPLWERYVGAVDPASAPVAVRNADHFAHLVENLVTEFYRQNQRYGIIAACYDTELFGHWWLEGVEWMEATIRHLADDPEVALVTAGTFVAEHPPANTVELPEGSWGEGGDHRTWMNEETAWTWPEIRARQARAARLLDESTPATRQLARELLLLQSSDWQFLMTTGQAHDYAVERFKAHSERFDRLADAIESRDPELSSLATQYESLDNVFPDIDPRRYSAGTSSPAFA